jgi:hypothetical protein
MNRVIFCVCLLFILVLWVAPSGIIAQSKPPPFNQVPKSDPNDDERLCVADKKPLANDKYCKYYAGYKINVDTNNAKAEDYRNQMIDLLQVQIDEYYAGYKNGHVKNTKWFQSVLDILGVGLAFTGNIVGGIRTKTVLAATSSAFQAGRNSVNERFDLLKQQILINKMNANRTNQWARIVGRKGDGVSAFGWDSAKAEMQQYFFRGSFEDALDSLVDDTGAQVRESQQNLQHVLSAVSNTELTAKLINFTDYLVPMNKTALQLDAEIAAISPIILALPLGAAKVQKQAEEADLKAKKTALLENYKNILTAIKVGGDFDIIDQKIRGKYPAAVVGLYDTYFGNLKATPPTITADQYDFILTKINAVVGEDAVLNRRFMEILKTHKLP